MNNHLIYHIMIDRFFPVPTVDQFNERSFNKGTLRGIIEKLDYIKELGMTGIMLTPFYENAQNSYHGYHITDYTKVDKHFGDWNDVKNLVSEVHQRNMIIVADFVANHCHENNHLFKDGQHMDWFLYKSDGHVKGFSDLGFLPMFDTDNQEVREYLTGIALNLCKLGFDAIRLDHATGPSYSFWRYFCNKLKNQYPKINLIGEVWGELDFKPRKRVRYWWNHFRYDAQEARQMEYVGVLDGVFDFYYQSLLCEFVRRGEYIVGNVKLTEKVNKHFKHYPKNFELWLFLDNHDLDRFLFECKQDKKLLDEALQFSKQWNKTFLSYYGTEQNMTNTKSVFDGSSYADTRVRQLMGW